MKSLTLEDIFDDYHNNKICISCNKQGDNAISKFNMEYYDGGSFIYRRKIRKNAITNLKIKHYIKIGDCCSICFDEINHRRDAFLTDCGHSFHYSCIMNYEYKTYFTINGILCPICRQDMGNYNDIKNIYHYSKNEIDKLINFETNYKTKIPKICFDLFNLKFNDHFHLTHYNSCIFCRL
jgi:hypothetical protein